MEICYLFYLFFSLRKLKIRCHVNYTLFTCSKELLKFEIFIQYVFFKFFKFHNFQIVSVFLNVDNQLTSSQFFSHQNSFIKRIFNLITYKIDYFWCNYYSSSKVLYENQNPKSIFLNFYFEFFNVHIIHLAQHSMINIILKWHHKNISNKIIVFIKFW
jgi:hypothetical protein